MRLLLSGNLLREEIFVNHIHNFALRRNIAICDFDYCSYLDTQKIAIAMDPKCMLALIFG